MAEFNTYDILKQRYLVLTREALTTLKDRVKQKARGERPLQFAPARPTRRRLIHGYPAPTPELCPIRPGSSSPTRSSSGR